MRGCSAAAKSTFAIRTVRRLSECAASRSPATAAIFAAVLAAVVLAVAAISVAFTACGGPPPRVTITEIPPAALGGTVRTAAIAGRVEGAQPGDRVVLFA